MPSYEILVTARCTLTKTIKVIGGSFEEALIDAGDLAQDHVDTGNLRGWTLESGEVTDTTLDEEI